VRTHLYHQRSYSQLWILTRELSDRHNRAEEDKAFISDRTSRTLRQLGTSHRMPRVASSSRRSIALSEFLQSSTDDLVLDDDEDLGTYIEGTSFNALSDAFIRDSSTPSFFPPSSRSVPSSQPVITRDVPLVPVSIPMSAATVRAFPPLRSQSSRRLPRISESSSSLTRQNSLRRTGRARTTDFYDFTSRRRSATRDGADEYERASDAIGGPWSTRPHEGGDGATGLFHDPQSTTWRGSSYPFRQQEVGGLFPLESVDPTAPFRILANAEARHSHAHLLDDSFRQGGPVLPPFSWFGTEDNTHRVFDDEDDLPRFFSEPEEMEGSQAVPLLTPARAASPVLPRLRRGGLRAPEVMTTEHIHVSLSAEHAE
jgi:hypothetical protein